MRRSKVLAKARAGEAALGVCLHLTDPSVYELTGLMGFDAIWMDLEHHGYSVETAQGLMRAARVGDADIVARPGKGEFMRMARLLESGATGIMYPRCDNAAEAAEVVKWAKFAPVGKRGFDGSGADVPFLLDGMESYIRQANEQTFVLIQVEEPSAVAEIDAIAAVPGVDMLMLGPGDFSVLTGIPGQFGHPSIVAALEAVAAAAKRHGKLWAATCGSPAYAKRMIEMGCSLVFHGCDIVFVKQGLDAVKQAFAEQVGLHVGHAPGATNGTVAGVNGRVGKSYLEEAR